MTSRSSGEPPQDTDVLWSELMEGDAFFDALAQGTHPEGYPEELSAPFLAMREYVHADLPPVPQVEELLAAAEAQGSDVAVIADSTASIAATASTDAVSSDSSSSSLDDAPSSAPVISLAARRQRARNRRNGATDGSRQTPRWISSMMSAAAGAAAATVITAGSVSAIYNADEGGALWSTRVAIFGEPKADLVQLTSTLEEVDRRSADGDVQGAQELLAEAQRLLEQLNQKDRELAEQRILAAEASLKSTPVTTTVTETLTETELAFLTETSTVTTTVTPEPTTPKPSKKPTETPLPENHVLKTDENGQPVGIGTAGQPLFYDGEPSPAPGN